MVGVENLWQFAQAVLLAGAIYGGIRADIKGIHARLTEQAENLRRAHARIDAILGKA